MTITELYDDPQKLAEWLGMDPDGVTESYYPYSTYVKVKVPGTERAKAWLREHRRELHREFVRSTSWPGRWRRNWSAFIRNCAKELGIKASGSIEDIRLRCMVQLPGIYTLKEVKCDTRK